MNQGSWLKKKVNISLYGGEGVANSSTRQRMGTKQLNKTNVSNNNLKK